MIINLTPHALTLRAADGTDTILVPSGMVARVASTPGSLTQIPGIPIPVATATVFGAVTDLPDPTPGTFFIVSGMVGAALVGHGRADVLMPVTAERWPRSERQGPHCGRHPPHRDGVGETSWAYNGRTARTSTRTVRRSSATRRPRADRP